MTRRVSWSLLLGCALIASLDASTAWSILTRTLRVNHSFAGELELVGDPVPRKSEPTSIPDRSLPRRPMSAPAFETFQRPASTARLARNGAPRASVQRAAASDVESLGWLPDDVDVDVAVALTEPVASR